jgi:glycosyltransferase involved in cell wall biosynthesis
LIIRFGCWASKHISQVAYVSEKSQAQHHEIGYSKNNSCLIPNGFDTDKFKPSTEARINFRKELGVPSDAFVIGTVARYHPMKDQANFIKAAKILLNERPETIFVMVGHHVDEKNTELTTIINELGIADNIRLLGLRQDMHQITPALDILATSSAYGEAFPMVVGEAMSCGVPCVVTDIGDSGWIVGNTGRVVPPKDSDALAQAWHEIISMDSNAKQVLSESARIRIEDNFALRLIVEQYQNLYQRIAISA